MFKNKVVIVAFSFATIFFICAGCNKNNSSATNLNENVPATSIPEVVAPISRAKERVTKKPFGIYITPKTSPVQPEKFTGYHSGTDFETFPDEQTADVQINVICEGELASKRSASGYGGVATQYCTIDGKKVTVIYGHMRLSSITPKIGDALKAGDHLGVLGTGFSSETDGERKHLHLGIEIGQGTDIRGYVQQKSQLSSFLDVMTLM